jgi:hypothetical protein
MWLIEFRYSGTGLIACSPIECQNQDEADTKAENYNKYNQDRTWNCIYAYAIYQELD